MHPTRLSRDPYHRRKSPQQRNLDQSCRETNLLSRGRDHSTTQGRHRRNILGALQKKYELGEMPTRHHRTARKAIERETPLQSRQIWTLLERPSKKKWRYSRPHQTDELMNTEAIGVEISMTNGKVRLFLHHTSHGPTEQYLEALMPARKRTILTEDSNSKSLNWNGKITCGRLLQVFANAS